MFPTSTSIFASWLLAKAEQADFISVGVPILQAEQLIRSSPEHFLKRLASSDEPLLRTLWRFHHEEVPRQISLDKLPKASLAVFEEAWEDRGGHLSEQILIQRYFNGLCDLLVEGIHHFLDKPEKVPWEGIAKVERSLWEKAISGKLADLSGEAYYFSEFSWKTRLIRICRTWFHAALSHFYGAEILNWEGSLFYRIGHFLSNADLEEQELPCFSELASVAEQMQPGFARMMLHAGIAAVLARSSRESEAVAFFHKAIDTAKHAESLRAFLRLLELSEALWPNGQTEVLTHLNLAIDQAGIREELREMARIHTLPPSHR